MGRQQKSSKIKSLQSGRVSVPNATSRLNPTRSSTRLSSKASRTIIRSHHRLSKALHDAESAGDHTTSNLLLQRINSQGGLQSYQHASLLGQSAERGGDSSKVLVEWIKSHHRDPQDKILRILEVGALSIDNAISKYKSADVTRIDLNSQQKGIEKQDFMERPLPSINDELGHGGRFDILSLSLVLNFVPSAIGRGEMLKRVGSFLDLREEDKGNGDGKRPWLFLVLPVACVENSRYMDQARLGEIMESLGYKLVERKLTAKLIYDLWECHGITANKDFKKKEVRPGGSRNNFAIVL